MHQPHKNPGITLMTMPPRKPVMGPSLTQMTPLSQWIAHTQKHYTSWQFTCTNSLQTQPDLPSPVSEAPSTTTGYSNQSSCIITDHYLTQETEAALALHTVEISDKRLTVTTITSAKTFRQGKDSGVTHYSHTCYTANPCQPAQPHRE